MNEYKIKSIALYSYIDNCNGMCRRVMKDIKELPYDNYELLEAYFNDKEGGGRDYSEIIELGALLNDLEEKYKENWFELRGK
ncbi:hypothetical protein [Clostridium sp. YIM B02551]|uniref:hypothetical protein n=1 Tax=Clostridium sp. YIM B02551 TaxID=2910679 RepID=UPI001EEB10A3|nr:hypothetical protein [Clostridium sp. YIM B02551]